MATSVDGEHARPSLVIIPVRCYLRMPGHYETALKHPSYRTILTSILITVTFAMLHEERMVVPVHIGVGRQAFMKQFLQAAIVPFDAQAFQRLTGVAIYDERRPSGNVQDKDVGHFVPDAAQGKQLFP